MSVHHYSSLLCAKHMSSKNITWFKWNTVSLCITKTNRDVTVILCILHILDLLLFSKDVYSLKCLFANNLNQYITSWSKSPFRWLNGNESISWMHRKCFSKLCVHRMRTKIFNRCADLVKIRKSTCYRHVYLLFIIHIHIEHILCWVLYSLKFKI